MLKSLSTCLLLCALSWAAPALAADAPAAPAQAQTKAVQAAQPQASAVQAQTALPQAPSLQSPAQAQAQPPQPQTQGAPAAGTQTQPAPQTKTDPAEHKAPAPSVALIRRLARDTELPAMQLSLGLVSFVGETDPAEPGEDAYAILPLNHGTVLEVYDLLYDGSELTQAPQPTLVREMGVNEAYVVHVPFFGGMPARGVCVTTNGKRHCWRPAEGELNEGFLHWSRTKGIGDEKKKDR